MPEAPSFGHGFLLRQPPSPLRGQISCERFRPTSFSVGSASPSHLSVWFVPLGMGSYYQSKSTFMWVGIALAHALPRLS